MRRVLLAILILFTLTVGSPMEAAAGRVSGSIAVNPAQPHFSDTLTFTIETSTSQPYVTAFCWLGGQLWFYETHPYFGPDYPASATFVLPSPTVSGTAASCTARVYKLAKNGVRLLVETAFTVEP